MHSAQKECGGTLHCRSGGTKWQPGSASFGLSGGALRRTASLIFCIADQMALRTTCWASFKLLCRADEMRLPTASMLCVACIHVSCPAIAWCFKPVLSVLQ